jgi:GNAT superfamily N-acetyltransferase
MDRNLLDIPKVHGFIKNSYWASEIPFSIFEKSVFNSLCFGVYEVFDLKEMSLQQIGFARVVSDFATFAYLGDVYIEEAYRGQGLSKWLMSCVFSHSELQGLRRFCLGTKDAHKLYEKFGFKVIPEPQNWMEIRVKDIYKTKR